MSFSSLPEELVDLIADFVGSDPEFRGQSLNLEYDRKAANESETLQASQGVRSFDSPSSHDRLAFPLSESSTKNPSIAISTMTGSELTPSFELSAETKGSDTLFATLQESMNGCMSSQQQINPRRRKMSLLKQSRGIKHA